MIIDAIHYSKRKWDMFPVHSTYSSGWVNIVKEGHKIKVNGSSFIHLLKCEVGYGDCARFWIDDWVPNGVLKDRFPALFKLETVKRCTVGDRMKKGDQVIVASWSWKKPFSTAEEMVQFQALMSVVQQTHIKMGADVWRWDDDPGGSFSAAAVRKWLAASRPGVSNPKLDWCKWVPIKCNIFMWRLMLKRIPTKLALLRRNINVENTTCVLCGDGEDEVDHIFTDCAFSMSVWNGVLRWLGLPNYFAFSVSDILDIHKVDGISATRKHIIKGMVMVCCWCIWRARNDCIFNQKRSNVVEVVAEIKAFGFLWFSNRHKNFVKDWKGWSSVMLL
ncbi:uncharacterized protein LOC110907059 [Helianthus annuus]|uniref:uncharacterized protein LOC110907059 n=1 Tax=Helianthus annuus TaxID=4232 RepID=UPI000B905510|nr:uncharacterized protein LOC110907059 [Helianthus annuus]